MDNFDRSQQLHSLWRYVALALGIVAISLLIGIAVGRPFDNADRANPNISATISPIPPTLAPSPTTEVALVATSAPTQSLVVPTFSPEAAWQPLSQDSFDKATTWPAATQPGWSSGYENGRYRLKLTGQRTITYSVPVDAPECWAAVDVQVSSGYAGLVFLSGDANSVYRLLIDNAGRYRLERQRAGGADALRDWTATPAIHKGADATNRIEARRVDNEVTLIANGVDLMKYTLPDNAQVKSRIGMTLDAVARDTTALAYFDNLLIRIPVVAPDR